MNYRYSASTKGFYSDSVEYNNLPNDLVEVTGAEHDALFEAQSQGKLIESDENGIPVAVDRPAPSSEALASNTRITRDRRMKAFEWRLQRYDREVRLGMTTTDNLSDLDAYMQALADVPEQPGFPESIDWPVEP